MRAGLPGFRRSVAVPATVTSAAGLSRGERVLAGAEAADGTWLLGTRDDLVLVPPEGDPVRTPWEQVERADWDRDEERLVVTEVGEYGRVRPVRRFTVAEPRRLLELVRERVTASVVLQRRVTVDRQRGLVVVARRPPRGRADVAALVWAVEYDEGVDPDDPDVRQAVEQGLAAAREEVGA